MRGHKQTTTEPTMMFHHVREIQMRLLSVVSVLIVGMVVGYLFYQPLFEFIKAPLHGSLHYMSPSGSFLFIVKICMMIGVIAALPVAVYNVIMFIQPALEKRLSRSRVYFTTTASLVLAGTGAGFGFLIIVPLALHFFYGFQIDGLVAIISADEYLRFVMGITITFAVLFQLPLLLSLADHIRPLPPRTLLKFEKYVVLGSIVVAIVVPFANDLTVQTLVASPVIILYNLSIIVVIIQQAVRRRRERKQNKQQLIVEQDAKQFVRTTAAVVPPYSATPVPLKTMSSSRSTIPTPIVANPKQTAATVHRPMRSMDGTLYSRSTASVRVQPRTTPTRVISDIRRPVVPPRRSPGLSSGPAVINDKLSS